MIRKKLLKTVSTCSSPRNFLEILEVFGVWGHFFRKRRESFMHNPVHYLTPLLQHELCTGCPFINTLLSTSFQPDLCR